jgi:hypothetical protein
MGAAYGEGCDALTQTSLRFPMLSYLYPMPHLLIYVRIYATGIVIIIAANIVFVDMPTACARAKQNISRFGMW